MALVTAGEDDVISLRLWLPRIGAWTADVLFDDASPRAGRVTLTVGDRQFVGTIDRGGEFEDTDRTRVVAGAGGLGKAARPRQYSSPTVQVIVSDLLSAAGETLASSSDGGLLGSAVPSWTTSAEPIGQVITALMHSVGGGAVWRMLPDGTLWVGRETWPDSGIDPSAYQVMSKRFEDGSWLVTVDEETVAALLPGTTLEGQKVSLVIHNVDDEEDVGPRMRVWFADGDEGAMEDRVAAAFERAVRAAGPPPVDYRAMYFARVVAQVGSKVHVEPELIGTIPDMGAIPLLLGLPAATIDGLNGGNVLVGWRGGDRAKAYAVCFDADADIASLKLAPAALQLGGGELPQPVPLGTGLITYLATLAAAINSLGGSAAPPEPTTLLSGSVTVTS